MCRSLLECLSLTFAFSSHSASAVVLRTSSVSMAAPDALGPISRADITVLDAENKELRKRLADLDKEIEEAKYVAS